MLCAAVLGVPMRVPAQNIIATVAGDGRAFFSGDDGPATSASLNQPNRVAVDGAGNLFIADSNNNRIRRVDGGGIITTVAGNGVQGFGGDGGPATSARLNRPNGVTVDSYGNLFIADTRNNRIRRVDLAGIITTVAGNGVEEFSGDGGPATSAGLWYPVAVAVDGFGNLFIADTNNYRIRRVDDGGIITTVAGNGLVAIICETCPATSTGVVPFAVALDRAGNVFLVDEASSGSRVRRVNSAGIISTVAGNGSRGFGGDYVLATSTSLNQPAGVALDSAGNLFIADSNNFRIRRVDGGGIITTVAGNGVGGFSGDGGPATSASLDGPGDIAMDSYGNLFIADTRNHRVRLVQGAGNISTFAGNGVAAYSGDHDAATSASLNRPNGMDTDFFGHLFIADQGNNRIRHVDLQGIIDTVAGNGDEGYSGDDGFATSASLNHPNGVAVNILGHLFIADTENHRIRRVHAFTHLIITVAGNGVAGYSGDGDYSFLASLNGPEGVALDDSGSLYIADTQNHRIRRVDFATGFITTVAGNGVPGFGGDGGPATSASLNFPSAVAVGNAGNLFIADASNNRIRRVDGGGIITTVAGNGVPGFGGDGGPATSASLNQPTGVAADTAGNLFIADAGNARIRKVDDAGNITTVAGHGVAGFSGDGGWATSARLNSPAGVVVDGNGNLFIGDSDNHRIRRVTPKPAP